MITEVCSNCGKYVDVLDDDTGWCVDCSPASTITRLRQYLTSNADELEHFMLQGNSFNQAVDLLHHQNGRPKCLSCGDVITRAPRNAIFCRRKPECRRQSRRYVYLYRERGLTKAEALAKLMEEL